jgi:ubiquinone/menaquinone biosynthesis C-methylase UbiE
MMSMSQDLYTSGDYLKKNPLWHVDESPWKARYVLQIIAKNKIAPKTICDVGCGAGEVLKLVQEGMDKKCMFWGYEISPQAFELCQQRVNERLHFKLADIREEEGAHFDLILLLDVLEHMEDYFSFLREIQPKSEYKIIQLPMDINARDVLLGNLVRFRRDFGHLHYFIKDVALQMLKDVGYEVVDYLYTWQSNSFQYELKEIIRMRRNLPRRLAGLIARTILGVPRRLFFAIHKDLAVRAMGGWRLMFLAK